MWFGSAQPQPGRDREGLVYDKSSCRLRVSRNWPGDCYSGIRKFDVEYQPLISVKGWKKLLVGYFYGRNECADDTGRQLRGVESYNIINTFLDPVSHRPKCSVTTFSEHKPEPRRIDEGVRVSDVFYRRHVSQIVIAYMVVGIYAVYIKSPTSLSWCFVGWIKTRMLLMMWFGRPQCGKDLGRELLWMRCTAWL